MTSEQEFHQIIVVGGGAGGLELATQLGDNLGKRRKAAITLVDCNMTHLWKPLLHEVAAGALNAYEDELSYMAQAHWHHFRFRLGRMDGLDRGKREISLAPSCDEQGNEYIPRRILHYDTLIIAVGSITNDFNIPGVKEHCMLLDTRQEADRVVLLTDMAARTYDEFHATDGFKRGPQKFGDESNANKAQFERRHDGPFDG